MKLGTFSISLAVKDIKASREFYEKLGFSILDGDEAQNWLIMDNGTVKVGLFQGMFEKNILTFHPSPSKGDMDVRAIQADLKAKGVTLILETDKTEGPAHITAVDPDGNPILIDQFE